MRIRGGSGLGDSVYVRPVVDYYVKNGARDVEVCSNFPDVFIGSGATVVPFSRERINILAHYSMRKKIPSTNQWQDICISAGVKDLPLSFRWSIRNHDLVQKVRIAAGARPIMITHGGRPPMGRSDGFGIELLPKAEAFAHAQKAMRDCFFVRVGKGGNLYHIYNDLDLCDATSVSDLLDLFYICDGVLAQCSFAIPMAEAFDKLLVAVWANKGLTQAQPYVKQITPQKILSKPSSWFVVDHWSPEQIQQEIQGVRLVC